MADIVIDIKEAPRGYEWDYYPYQNALFLYRKLGRRNRDPLAYIVDITHKSPEKIMDESRETIRRYCTERVKFREVADA